MDRRIHCPYADSGALASGFEPGNLYASYARDQKGLDVQNCGWDNYECKEKFDFVTAFHVFEHLTHPLKAFKKAISWLNQDGLIYIEVPNMANSLKLKGFGSLHMATQLVLAVIVWNCLALSVEWSHWKSSMNTT